MARKIIVLIDRRPTLQQMQYNQDVKAKLPTVWVDLPRVSNILFEMMFELRWASFVCCGC